MLLKKPVDENTYWSQVTLKQYTLLTRTFMLSVVSSSIDNRERGGTGNMRTVLFRQHRESLSRHPSVVRSLARKG